MADFNVSVLALLPTRIPGCCSKSWQRESKFRFADTRIELEQARALSRSTQRKPSNQARLQGKLALPNVPFVGTCSLTTSGLQLMSWTRGVRDLRARNFCHYSYIALAYTISK